MQISNAVYKDQSADFFLGISMYLQGGEQLSLRFGYSSYELPLDALSTKSFLLGVSSDPLKPWSLGAAAEFWGNDDALTSEQLTFSISHWREPWDIRFEPKYKRLSLYGRDVTPDQRFETRPRMNINSYAASLSIAYMNFQNWSHRIHASYHYYSEDISRLNINKATDILRTLRFLSFAVFSLTTGIEKSNMGYELGLNWRNLIFFMDLNSSTSAVTRQSQKAASLEMSYAKNDWTLGINYSATISGANDSVVQTFLSVPFK